MATAADIAEVRVNVNEPTEDIYTDAAIGTLIDAGSVVSASAAIWRTKAGAYAEMADVSEAGASLKVSDLYKRALEMVAYYDSLDGEVVPAGLGRGKTHKIVRT